MNLSDLLVSYIRTYVPLAVGSALTWLAATLGAIDPPAGLVPWIVALTTATYYLLVRLLEQRWPALGWLLGRAQTPTYNGNSARYVNIRR